MKKFSRKILVTASVIFTSLFFSQKANAYDFYIKEGKQFDLCKEIKQMLDEPENKHFGEPFMKGPEIPILKKYKNFSLPIWEDISISDLPKYMKQGDALQAIQDFNDGKPTKIFLYGGKYGVTQKIMIQKTFLDFDGDGKKENIIRYKPDSDSILYSNVPWSLYVEDAKEETVLSKTYNKYKAKYFIFLYEGKVFGSQGIDSIYEPKRIMNGDYFGMISVCRLSMSETQQKIYSSSINEYYKEGGEYKTKLQEMEQAQKLKTQSK